jgi:hypothetical protein
MCHYTQWILLVVFLINWSSQFLMLLNLSFFSFIIYTFCIMYSKIKLKKEILPLPWNLKKGIFYIVF